ncbi:hypothetical protein [Haliangium sp.]|uniref:hypothetical protein n=1 Tax=Haliangium sp. TaxID=2663208 RepID=UPI003D09D95D
MSIVWSLKRLFDIATQRYEEGELEAEREQPECTESGAPPTFEWTDESPPEAPPPRYRCRLCGADGDDDTYCFTCLADTMQVLPSDAVTVDSAGR